MFKATIITVIPELTKIEFDILLHFVSSKKQERIKQFHFFQDARNCLIGDVLTRFEICRTTGLSNKQLKFSINDYGKPFLIGNPHIHFNVSHTGCYVACSVADRPVGIDIELIKSTEQKIAERFYTADEAEYIATGEYECRFYEVWTKKESRIKWEGKGLHKPLTSFSVFTSDECAQITYHKIFQNNQAICYVCSTKQELPAIQMMDTASFMQSVMIL